jgi:predicted secreted hydrolase
MSMEISGKVTREARLAPATWMTALLCAALAPGWWLPAGALERAWKQADPAYRIELPRDHAAHPDYRIEWWYYTGNLDTPGGRRFGYQLTFFRVGVDPAPENPSRWAVRDLYIAHFAVTDVRGGRHRYADRLNRGGVGWAGAASDRYEVWNESWRATLDASGAHVLSAREGGLGLELRLEEGKPVVLHGEAGYSRKGSEPGNASHYYSLTRMPTRGTLTIDGERIEVAGLSWMDHEFGTSVLEPAQLGWDWFSMQLDDGTDLMLFEMRRSDGRRDPHSSGTLVDRDGRARHLGANEFTLTPLDTWRSPDSGADYPIAWRLALPGHGLQVEARAVVPAQELRTERSTAVTYWEGAIDVTGTRRGRAVGGRGYLEMTGYTGRPMSELFR